jgi:hypothetical protein
MSTLSLKVISVVFVLVLGGADQTNHERGDDIYDDNKKNQYNNQLNDLETD